jgi:DNA-binding NtrC family response regulator
MVKNQVIITGWDVNYTQSLCATLEKEHYELVLAKSLPDAKTELGKQSSRVMLIDLDQTTLDNRSLKELRKEYPLLGLVGLSSRRFHQELEEAMSRYIDACFEKSEDYEDLLYWLKAVFDPSFDRGSQGKGLRP